MPTGGVGITVNVNKTDAELFLEMGFSIFQIRENICRNLGYVEFSFGCYLENLIGMNTRIEDSIELGRMKRDGQQDKSLEGIPEGEYL